MNRRNFLAVSAAAGVVACSRGPHSPWRALSESQAAALEAWCDCLIPEDADPGSKRGRVVRYIDTQLTRRYKRYRADYTLALAALDDLARRRHDTPFAQLPLEIRTALLHEFETGEHRKRFDLVLDHAMQGFYGNPRHGGNADFASWRMMGVPPAPVRGRLQYSIANQDAIQGGKG